VRTCSRVRTNSFQRLPHFLKRDGNRAHLVDRDDLDSVRTSSGKSRRVGVRAYQDGKLARGLQNDDDQGIGRCCSVRSWEERVGTSGVHDRVIGSDIGGVDGRSSEVVGEC